MRRFERLALTCLVIATLAPGPRERVATGQEPSRAEQQKRVEQKMTEAIDLLPAWVRAGGNFWTIITAAHKVSEYVNALDFVRAEETADQILGILKNKQSPRAYTAINSIGC